MRADSNDTILVQIDRIARLFNSLDPTPFRERDLDHEAERFIVDWAQEAPANTPIKIVIQLPKEEAEAEQTVRHALRYNFESRVDQTSRELRELFREGRRVLLIGMPILAFSLVASQIVINVGGGRTFAHVISESLLIFGWVANWQAMEIFLYGWWPIRRRRNLYRRLASSDVKVVWS